MTRRVRRRDRQSGGHVEPGETPEQATLRELEEETTLTATIDTLLWTGTHNGRPAYYFLATNITGTPAFPATKQQPTPQPTATHSAGQPPPTSKNSAFIHRACTIT